MSFKQIFNRKTMLRTLLFVGSLALIIFFMPRADHQSYSFEINQPWKYPLLTAEFDVPILRDSTTAAAMRDSINSNFVPFVKRERISITDKAEALTEALQDSLDANKVQALVTALRDVYQNGILDGTLAKSLSQSNYDKARMAGRDSTVIETINTSEMLSQAAAYAYIDSVYRSLSRHDMSGMPGFVARAVYAQLEPDVVIDKTTDAKFRSQELLEVTAAFGMIKQGQRIVDRGEIVTPQIYTNLNTYLTMLDEQGEDKTIETFHTIGRAIIVVLLVVLYYLFLYIYKRDFFLSDRVITFLMVYLTIFVLFSIFMFEFIPNGLNLVPFAAIPVVLIVFFDSRTAIFSLLVAVLIVSMIATFPHQFIIMETLAALGATFCVQQLTKRSQLLLAAFVAFAVYCFSFFALCLYRDGNLENFDTRVIGYFFINSVVLSFAYVMIVIIEKVFGFTSNVTLIELSDINHPLLRKLAEDAPGTFQHSMQVSNLAAAAANAVSANSQLVRTGALYHDVGKLGSPAFFTENQHGVNPHTGLDPENSAQILISHVTKGVSLAHKHKLPKNIRDFITEHHGRGLTKYFYNTAVNAKGEENVDKEKFRYPGPNPRSKETAILMMADAVEAASRSLNDYSTASINNLVDKIIDGQMAEGLYEDAPLSFQEIKKIKDVFKKRLSTLYHTRIAYPELKKA